MLTSAHMRSVQKNLYRNFTVCEIPTLNLTIYLSVFELTSILARAALAPWRFGSSLSERLSNVVHFFPFTPGHSPKFPTTHNFLSTDLKTEKISEKTETERGRICLADRSR